MRILKRSLLILVAAFLLIAGFVYANISYSSIPSKGDKITKHLEPGRALLVIAMQEDYSGQKLLCRKDRSCDFKND
jgi:hypothetical protein